MKVFSKEQKTTLFVCLALLGVMTLISCANAKPTPAPAPPLPSPGLPKAPAPGNPQPTPAEAWSPDGVIGSHEYLSEASYGDYELFWVNDAQYVYVAMKAKTSGWVAMAVQPGTKMNQADMVFGYVKDGTVTIFDLFSLGDTGPHPPDTDQGGKNDILAFGGSEQGGYTIIEFKRALDTSDQYDNKLAIGKNQIIWAHGSIDDLRMKHSARGYGEIILY